MSRSIGDNLATSVGVTWEPEVFEFTLEKNDKFMIIASDGVWEFLENIDIVRMVAKFYEKRDLDGACDCVM
jgi:serine/threonine protein phosphatase PrpC